MKRPHDSSTTMTLTVAPTVSASSSVSGLDRGLDTSGGLDFVRERLALLGKMVFLLSFGFLVLMVASVAFVGGVPLAVVLRLPVTLGHFFATSMIGVLWLLASRKTTSRALLGAIDAICVVGGCGFLAIMTLADVFQIQQAISAITVTTMARAILVPSRPLRTLLISALAFLPTIAMAVLHHYSGIVPPIDGKTFSPEFQRTHLVLNTVLWSILGITLTTVTSRVTYGLRQQVAEVSELGQYILEEKIGGGGMGEVWRARHRLLIRPAAVKIIRRDVLTAMGGDPGLLMRRFEREARATAALKSPHTVQLYDFGTTDDGTLYYVMELLDGFDLDTLIKSNGPIPAERAVHIMRQVCRSLADAHTNGLVHRDIKPANVIISRIGSTFDFAKVLDFGLVKLDSPHRIDEDALKLTVAGSTSGTPGFMAPEVVLGAAEADHRVDIYSLGCVAYWLLTGQLVFTADTPTGLLMKHIQSPPSPPSSRTELHVPPPMDRVVLACLAKEPADRPQSARELSRILAELNVEQAWTEARCREWWERHQPSAAT